MNQRIDIAEILALSAEERISLVERIWDSIAEVPDGVRLTEEQRAELDRRLREFELNPAAGSPWDVVKARIVANGSARISDSTRRRT